MKVHRLENEPGPPPVQDAEQTDTLDIWMLQRRLDRLDHDLAQQIGKTRHWKEAAREAARQREALQRETRELRALLQHNRHSAPAPGKDPQELAARDGLIRQLTHQAAQRDAMLARLREELETLGNARSADLSAAHEARIAAETRADEIQGSLAALTAEKTTLAAQLEEAGARIRDLEARLAAETTAKRALAEELGTARATLEDRCRDIAALGAELDRQGATLAEAQARVRHEKQALAEELGAAQATLEDRCRDIAALGTELDRQGRQLLQERTRRQEDTAALGRLLEETRRKLSETEAALQHRTGELHHEHHRQQILAQLADAKDRLNAALGMPLSVRRHQRARNRINEDMRLIAASGLFDGDWYLQAYPDVARAGGDPLRHFVRYGAYELRDPGPDFASLEYHLANPDVTAHGMAALVHYVRSGKSEGRKAFRAAPPQ